MPTQVRDATIGAALLALLCIVGCGQHTTFGVGERMTSWSANAGVSNSVRGIHEGSVSFVTMKAGPPEGISFVVWSDLSNGADGHGSGSTAGASYEGAHHANDGRRVEFRAETADGKSGGITIAGTDYDLAKGSLFLVAAHEDPPRVVQIAFDLSGFPRQGNLTEFAKSTASIRDFFEKHREAKAEAE
jgi:hypothetical protein